MFIGCLIAFDCYHTGFLQTVHISTQYGWIITRFPRKSSVALSRDHLRAHFLILLLTFIICKSITLVCLVKLLHFPHLQTVHFFVAEDHCSKPAASFLHAATQSLRRQYEFNAWNLLFQLIAKSFTTFSFISQVFIRGVRIFWSVFFSKCHICKNVI